MRKVDEAFSEAWVVGKTQNTTVRIVGMVESLVDILMRTQFCDGKTNVWITEDSLCSRS